MKIILLYFFISISILSCMQSNASEKESSIDIIKTDSLVCTPKRYYLSDDKEAYIDYCITPSNKSNPRGSIIEYLYFSHTGLYRIKKIDNLIEFFNSVDIRNISLIGNDRQISVKFFVKNTSTTLIEIELSFDALSNNEYLYYDPQKKDHDFGIQINTSHRIQQILEKDSSNIRHINYTQNGDCNPLTLKTEFISTQKAFYTKSHSQYNIQIERFDYMNHDNNNSYSIQK